MERRLREVENLVISSAFWLGRRVFVTGHTGFKGSWLALMLSRLSVRATGYNVGNSRAVASIRDLATILAAFYPEYGLSARFAPPREGYLASRVARSAPDTEKLERLGWRPQTDIADGFRRTIEIYSDIFNRRSLGASA